MSEAIGSIGQGEASRVSRLVAARVYGGPTGKAPLRDRLVGGGEAGAGDAGAQAEGAAGSGALPFYGNPASRVEAATAIAVGRVIDVDG
jgi:hypothetical protein